MNLLGKIFVTLILVMSTVFLGFSIVVYATHTNWRDEVSRTEAEAAATGKPLGLRYQLEAEQKKAGNLQVNIDKLQSALTQEQNVRRENVARLDQERVTLTRERDQLLLQEAQLRQGEREAVAAASEKQKALDAKLAEITLLREQLNEAYTDRDKQFTDAVKTTDELNRSVAELNRLKAQHVELAEQVAKAKLVLDRNGLDINTPVDQIPPKVDGLVLSSNARGRVEISLGSDEGLAKGHELIVYRLSGTDSKFLGKIRVLQTWTDRSVAQVIPEYKVAPIERDDRVATRLN